VSGREGRSSPEDLPEDLDDDGDGDAAFIDALIGPLPSPREMTREQSERLDRRFYAMVEEQRRAWARRQRRRRWAIASAVVAVGVVGVGVGLAVRKAPSADRAGAPALMKARAQPSATGSAGPRDSELVNGVGVPRR
jgi:hypothetical protein